MHVCFFFEDRRNVATALSMSAIPSIGEHVNAINLREHDFVEGYDVFKDEQLFLRLWIVEKVKWYLAAGDSSYVHITLKEA